MLRRVMGRGWIVAVALFLVLALARVSFWAIVHDEGATFDIALLHLDLPADLSIGDRLLPIGDVLAAGRVRGLDAFAESVASDRNMHPPLYYTWLHLWVHAFGMGPVSLRTPGILLGAFSVFAMYVLAWDLSHSRFAASAASLLLAASPIHIGSALYLRPYGFEIAIAIASCIALLRWRGAIGGWAEWGWFSAFTLLSTIGIYTLYHYVFVLIFQFAYLGLAALIAPRRSRGADLLRAFAGGGCIAVLYLPWLAHLFDTLRRIEGGDYYFVGFHPLSEWPSEFYELGLRMTMGHTSQWRQVVFAIFLSAVLVVVLRVVVARTRAKAAEAVETDPPPGATHAGLFFASVPVYAASMIFADAVRDTHSFWVWKTSIALVPLSLLAIAILLGRSPGRRFRWGALLLICATIASASVANVVEAATKNRPGRDRLARLLAANDDPSHVVLLDTRERGYATTALVHWWNLGIESVRVAFLRDPEVVGAAIDLARDPSVSRVTFVDFRLGRHEGPDDARADFVKAEEILTAAGKEADRLRQKVLYSNSVSR